MTKEEKIKLKKERSFRRKNKRCLKDKEYYNLAYNRNINRISIGRKIAKGRYFQCEMGYGDCEERGYCNGDC
jgi:hypothetical protein